MATWVHRDEWPDLSAAVDDISRTLGDHKATRDWVTMVSRLLDVPRHSPLGQWIQAHRDGLLRELEELKFKINQYQLTMEQLESLHHVDSSTAQTLTPTLVLLEKEAIMDSTRELAYWSFKSITPDNAFADTWQRSVKELMAELRQSQHAQRMYDHSMFIANDFKNLQKAIDNRCVLEDELRALSRWDSTAVRRWTPYLDSLEDKLSEDVKVHEAIKAVFAARSKCRALRFWHMTISHLLKVLNTPSHIFFLQEHQEDLIQELSCLKKAIRANNIVQGDLEALCDLFSNAAQKWTPTLALAQTKVLEGVTVEDAVQDVYQAALSGELRFNLDPWRTEQLHLLDVLRNSSHGHWLKTHTKDFVKQLKRFENRIRLNRVPIEAFSSLYEPNSGTARGRLSWLCRLRSKAEHVERTKQTVERSLAKGAAETLHYKLRNMRRY